MDMQTYLKEIRYAANVLIPAVWHEHDRLAKLESELDRLTKVVEHEYTSAQWLAMNAEDPDDAAMAAGRQWETYFGPDKERHGKQEAVSTLQQTVDAHRFSVAALSAALLQYGKPGISVVHGGLADAPIGRKVGAQALRDVIWQGRNQAIHWEEGRPHPSVIQCFQTLESDFGSQFAQFNTENVAFNVLDVLGWRDLTIFEADMALLR